MSIDSFSAERDHDQTANRLNLVEHVFLDLADDFRLLVDRVNDRLHQKAGATTRTDLRPEHNKEAAAKTCQPNDPACTVDRKAGIEPELSSDNPSHPEPDLPVDWRPGDLPAEGGDRPTQLSDNTRQIAWRTNVLDAYHEARDSGKPLITVFADEACQFCKDLKNGALKDPRLTAIADRAVFLVANPEADSDAATVADRLNVTGYPTVAVLSAKDNAIDEVGRVVGFMLPDEFIRQISQYLPGMINPEIGTGVGTRIASTNRDEQIDFGSPYSLYGEALNLLPPTMFAA